LHSDHLTRDAALRRISTGVAVPLNWFVTFEIRKRGLLLKKERSPRETHTFAGLGRELDASWIE
jgi:hypothetical protein